MSLFERFFDMFEAEARQNKAASKAKSNGNAQELLDNLNAIEALKFDNINKLSPMLEGAVNKSKALKKEIGNTQKASEKLANSFLTFSKNLAKSLGVMPSFDSIISALLTRSEEIEKFSGLAAKARLSIGDFDALRRCIRDLGGDMGTSGQELENFANQIAKAGEDTSSAAAKSFASLNIGVKDSNGELRDTKEILLDLAQSAGQLSKMQATALFRKFSLIDPGILALLTKGKDAMLEQLTVEKKSGTLTQEHVRLVKKYRKTLAEWKDALKNVSDEVLTVFMPALTKILDLLTMFVRWCQKHKVAVSIFFTSLAVAIGVYAAAMGIAAIATGTLTAPILLLIGALAGLSLIIEDVWNYTQGFESELGTLVERFPALGTALQGVGIAWQGLKNVLVGVFSGLQYIWSMLVDLWNGDLDAFGQKFINIFRGIKEFWLAVGSDIQRSLQHLALFIQKTLQKILPTWLFDILYPNAGKTTDKAAQNAVEEMSLSKVEHTHWPRDKNGVTAEVKAHIAATHQTPIAAQTGAIKQITNTTNLNVSAPVVIKNVADSQEAVHMAANKVRSVLHDELTKCAIHADNGIAR